MNDDELIQHGITILRSIFPDDTTYTVSELVDPDGGDKVKDCEIGTNLSVDDALKLLDRFDDIWINNARIGIVFTLKFNEK